MRGRIFTVLSALSLAVCVATLSLWVRSQWVTDEFGYRRDSPDNIGMRPTGAVANWRVADELFIQSEKGHLELRLCQGYPNPWRVGWYLESESFDGPTLSAVHFLDDYYPDASAVRRWMTGQGFSFRFALKDVRWIALPHWFVCLATGSIPIVLHLRRHRAASRRRYTTKCPACGYDLRASPDRCPECGVVPTEAKA